LILSCPALAEIEEEIRILQMYFKEDELVVTSTRTPKSLSQVAENISIITYEEIYEMNYHTLAEVMNNIPGMQVHLRTPWAATVFIQGNYQQYSTVKIDGVTVNSLASNIADFGTIPVQNIEKIEIIKGPASSVWGSSLGGIINIITKPAGESTKSGGTLSVSYGEHIMGDSRAEVSGGTTNIGYYLYAGNINSSGFEPNTGFNENNLYTSLKWDITKSTAILHTFGYNKGLRGFGEFALPLPPPFDLLLSYNNEFEHLFSTLSLNYSINHAADLSISLRTSQRDYNYSYMLETGGEYKKLISEGNETGGSIKFSWGNKMHNVVIGADYDNRKPDSYSVETNYSLISSSPDAIATIDKTLENWAIYTNDTIIIDRFSLTPGIRYDHTNVGGDFLSPSLGITYKLFEKTILRAYTAGGFNAPSLENSYGRGFRNTSNPDLEVEKVWSYQAGVETNASNYLWLKASFFRHDIKDAIDKDASFKWVNQEKQTRQGFEVEIKTVPVYNISLFAGFTYVDADNHTSGEQITEYAKYTCDTSIKYNDNESFRAALKGHYIWWIPSPGSHGKYDTFIWDINLIKNIKSTDEKTVETFLTVHNIFNGSQYLLEQYKNPRRWIEGGITLKF
jgi:vitamin B12 transporter